VLLTLSCQTHKTHFRTFVHLYAAMKRKYTSESHRRESEACQREVEEMLQHPLTFEEALAQAEELRRSEEETPTP